MQIGLHGTSLENALNILKEGYKPKLKIWNPSTYNMFVFKSDNFNKDFQSAAYQSLNATFMQEDENYKRAVILVNLKSKNLIKDNLCTINSFEIVDCITSNDILAIYCDNTPIPALFKFVYGMQMTTMENYNKNLLKFPKDQQYILDHYKITIEGVTSNIQEMQREMSLLYKNNITGIPKSFITNM